MTGDEEAGIRTLAGTQPPRPKRGPVDRCGTSSNEKEQGSQRADTLLIIRFAPLLYIRTGGADATLEERAAGMARS